MDDPLSRVPPASFDITVKGRIEPRSIAAARKPPQLAQPSIRLDDVGRLEIPSDDIGRPRCPTFFCPYFDPAGATAVLPGIQPACGRLGRLRQLPLVVPIHGEPSHF